MNRTLSLYLDFLRAVASIVVVIYHFRLEQFSGGMIKWFNFGDEAVIVFFVLSGFVISYVGTEKESEPKIFLFKRFARLYSVLIPAVLFSFFVDFLIKTVPFHQFLISSAFVIKDTLTFTTDNWSTRTVFHSNTVFWSLSYEFWYYIFFLFSFLFKGKSKYIFISVLVLFLGYKIILLLPIWLLGVYLYKENHQFSKPFSMILFVLSSIFFLVTLYFSAILQTNLHFDYLGSHQLPLENSGNFIYQLLIGLIVMVNILSIKHLTKGGDAYKINETVVKIIRFFASISFSLYCFHMAVFYLLLRFIPFNSHSAFDSALVFSLAFGILVLIGVWVERIRFNPLSKEKIFVFLTGSSLKKI